jgi:mycothiol synthase
VSAKSSPWPGEGAERAGSGETDGAPRARRQHLTRGVPGWLDARAARARDADGQPPFSDQSLVEVADGQREILAMGHDAVAILAPGEPAEAEFVVDPRARGRGLGGRMLAALLESTDGGLVVWAHGDHPAARALARRHGLVPVRTLLQLRASVPASGPGAPRQAGAPADSDTPAGTGAPPLPPGISAFRPGRDDAEWLAVNAAAFADHPEQGRLTQHDLDARMAEPWFDPGDFLLLRDGDGILAGFCWLKVSEGVGELYAVGVDPRRQGEGLGRILVAAGLARLAERGIRDAMLYVEADNAPAVHLYRSFGFADHAVDVQYEHRP